jgi:hypothetical protein
MNRPRISSIYHAHRREDRCATILALSASRRADEIVGAQPVEDELQFGLEVGDLSFELGYIHCVAPTQAGSAVHVVDCGKRLKASPNIHGL